MKKLTVERETSEGETFCEFRGFGAIRESFLCEIWGRGILWCGKSEQFAKIFSLESFPLYGTTLIKALLVMNHAKGTSC